MYAAHHAITYNAYSVHTRRRGTFISVCFTVDAMETRWTGTVEAIHKVLQREGNNYDKLLLCKGMEHTVQVAPFMQGSGSHSLISIPQSCPV